MRRLGVLAWAGVVLVMLAGCTGSHPKLPDKAAQKKASSEMIGLLEALPGAKVSAHVTSSLDGGQGNVGVNAQLPAAASTAQLNAMADSIERIIWLSHLNPLGRISISLTRAGSSTAVLQKLYQDDIDTRPLRAKYGPRPDGLPQ